MGVIYTVHQVFGEMVLPLLIVIAAIWFTVAWRPNAAPSTAARLFPVLVDIQATIGLIYYVYRIALGAGISNEGQSYIGFPFILHPILGLLAAGVAHMAVKGGPFRRLGRWSALAALAVLAVLVLGSVALVTIT